jgi:hypothetical protein
MMMIIIIITIIKIIYSITTDASNTATFTATVTATTTVSTTTDSVELKMFAHCKSPMTSKHKQIHIYIYTIIKYVRNKS